MRRLLAALAFALALGGLSVHAQSADPASLVHYRTGLSLMSAEYWDEAARSFEKAIDVDAKFALAHYWLGRARLSGGKYRAAVQALEACRALYLEQLGARAGNQLAANQRRQDQLREIRDAIRQQQTGRQTAANQRIITLLENQAHELEMLGHSGIDFQLRAPAFVSLSLGSAYFRAEDLSKAETHYRAAIDVNAKLGEAHNNLAVVLMMTGRLTDAEAEIKLAERAGYHVNPQLKDDVKARRQAPGVR